MNSIEVLVKNCFCKINVDLLKILFVTFFVNQLTNLVNDLIN